MWRDHLINTLRINSHNTRLLMGSIQQSLHGVLAHGRCSNCRRETLQLDIAALMCGHEVCQDCLESLLTNQTDYFQRTVPVSRLGILAMLILCPTCQAPSVLKHQRVFDEGFATKRSLLVSAQRKLVVRHQLSEYVRAACHIVEVWENQRRGVLSRYSAEGLLLTDFRGPWSSEDGECAEPPEKAELPTSSSCWATDWKIQYDREAVDAEGWAYAFNWPTTGLLSWSLSLQWCDYAGPTSWVRRRRHFRVYIDFSEEVVALLNRLEQSVGDEEERMLVSVFTPLVST